MSVLLQPYQALPFYSSIDFQLRFDCNNCVYENIIQENQFIPFAIVSADELIEEISLFSCNDVFLQNLSLTIESTFNDETGLWFHYYNGDDFGLNCGSYYITIVVGGFILFSEMFAIKNVINTSQYPELIKDDFHLPLRIYDNITKQLANKCDIDCNISPLNPVSTILPFFFYTDEDICNLSIFLVNTCTLEETDLTADLELEFIKENEGSSTTVDIVTTSQLLKNEIYFFDVAERNGNKNFIFQEFRVNDYGTLKDITFEYRFYNNVQTITVSLIKGLNINTMPLAVITITDNHITSKELTFDFSSFNIQTIPGENYILKIQTNDQCTGSVIVYSPKIYPDGRFAIRNYIPQISNQLEYSIVDKYIIDSDTIKARIVAEDIIVQCDYNDNIPNASMPYTLEFLLQVREPVLIDTVKAVRVQMTDISINVTDGANIIIKLNYNSTDIYSTTQFIPIGGIHNITDVDFYFNVTIPAGSNASNPIYLFYQIDGVDSTLQSFISGNFIVQFYLYGEIIAGVYSPTNQFPTGINYLNKSLWFYVNVSNTLHECGTGWTKIYNPARPLPSPLICGNYYLKLVSNLHTWYSEWFRVINVGLVELTQYLLGTENEEIISGNDDIYIEI